MHKHLLIGFSIFSLVGCGVPVGEDINADASLDSAGAPGSNEAGAPSDAPSSSSTGGKNSTGGKSSTGKGGGASKPAPSDDPADDPMDEPSDNPSEDPTDDPSEDPTDEPSAAGGTSSMGGTSSTGKGGGSGSRTGKTGGAPSTGGMNNTGGMDQGSTGGMNNTGGTTEEEPNEPSTGGMDQGSTGGTDSGTGGTTSTGGTSEEPTPEEPSCTVGSVCRPADGSCDVAEVYDSNCNCPADSFREVGTLCGDDASCSNGTAVTAQTCNGLGACQDGTETECEGDCDGDVCEVINETVLDTSNDVATPLAIDTDSSGNVYVAARDSSGVARVIKYSGSTKTVLFTDANTSSNWIRALIVAETVEDSWVYFSMGNNTSGDIYRIETDGEGLGVIQGKVTFGFAKNSTHIFWSDMSLNGCNCPSPANARIYSVEIGAPITVATSYTIGLGEISQDIEVDEEDLYVWDVDFVSGTTYKAALLRFPLSSLNAGSVEPVLNGYYMDGSTPHNFWATATIMPGLTKNASHIFSNVGLPSANGIFKTGLNGGSTTAVTLTSNVGLTPTFSANSSKVFIEGQEISVNGGSMSSYTSQPVSHGVLTTNGSDVLFGTTDGDIVRIH
jgi:hypothetical protein